MFLVAPLTTSADDGDRDVEELVERLTTDGVTIANQPIKLRPMWLADGIDAGEQAKITDKIAGRRKKQFYRDSISATFESDIESIKDGERRAGYVVDFAFIVYASLDDLLKKNDDDQSGINSLANESEMTVTELTPKPGDAEGAGDAGDAEGAGDADGDSDKAENSRLVHGEFTLLEKVFISSVVGSSMKKTEESFTVAWEQDRSFDEPGEVSNSWKFVDATIANEPAVYNGFAGYAKVTKLKAPKGALLVEYHYAFAEPKEWSEQKISLRAKLSMVLQESVRKSRRHIKKMAAAAKQ